MLAVVVLIPLAAFEAVQILPTATLAYSRSRQSGERVIEVMDTPAPVIEPSNVGRLDRANLWPISLQCAGARWSNTHSSAPAAVTDVDLELMPGRTVAVVGESGAGKTTLSAMLLRFVELSSGRYCIGPVDARNVAGDEVRRIVGLCAQDAHIFDSTIRENLRLASPACDDDELHDALRRVRLLEWVERLPDGLDTHVGEGGQRLSEGERRRITVARALLADFPAIVFDEPTANLDQPTADALVRDLLVATADRATVLITHRLSALELVDEIIVLKNGSVAERGQARPVGPRRRPLRRLVAVRAWPRRARSRRCHCPSPVRHMEIELLHLGRRTIVPGVEAWQEIRPMPGRSVTSKVTAILMVFADGGVHTLTEIAAAARPTDLDRAPPGLRTGRLASARAHRGAQLPDRPAVANDRQRVRRVRSLLLHT